MRQTTRGTLKTCLATCAAMMLRLSPSVTATKPSASSTPALRSTSAAVHFGRDLGSDATAAYDHDLQSESIIGTPVKAPSGADTRALAWFAVRFPFTLLGLMAIAIGVWVAVYLTVHPGLDPVSNGLAFGTAVGAFAFGAYVLVRRLRRGPGN